MTGPISVPDLPAAWKAIDAARVEQGLSRAKLAGLTRGVSGSQYTEWGHGKHEPGASKLFALADTLGLRWQLVPMIENEDG